MIEEYKFGHAIVEGKTFNTDLKIINGHVIPNWWQETRHKIQPIDLQDIPDDSEFLVIGNGYSGRNNVTDGTIKMLEARSLPYSIEKTTEAVNTFNRLEKEGKRVMGAFHLTC